MADSGQLSDSGQLDECRRRVMSGYRCAACRSYSLAGSVEQRKKIGVSGIGGESRAAGSLTAGRPVIRRGAAASGGSGQGLPASRADWFGHSETPSCFVTYFVTATGAPYRMVTKYVTNLAVTVVSEAVTSPQSL